ncbi:type II toxin-antitoxin system PemK/MazF family toxin [Pseudactinotalea sp. HY160]|uniref:type II toxin-antitoxin system PemK/MazF family toxin n=1 Tax=Pseudactinotalea sp. HY160 TaxID=2654490 RepID=UPI001311C289|nr:type II toxin-antitoxin system PemK/MazF family toxin [Pseudactinotalea sp. HY160]
MRGDIFRLTAGDERGHEQGGPRYAVVIQSDDVMALSTWIVAPTSTSRAASFLRPEIEMGGTLTRVLVEHMRAVDPEVRLGDFAGRLTIEEMGSVDRAVRTVLGLD